jgi:soluble lytic murein transglycosylase-like protein
MADDLDRFVLQYSVELKDSIQRLEKLHEKMNKVETVGGKAVGNLKEFAKGAASEFERLVPGINAVSGAIGRMAGPLAIASTAVAALGFSIKSVLVLRNQMNQQRADSLTTGLSGARIEDLTRKLSTSGGGYVSRDAAAEGLRKFSELTNSAVRNPMDIALRKKMLLSGLNPGMVGNQTSQLQNLTDLAARVQGKSDEEVSAIAAGLFGPGNQQMIDWTRSIAKMGVSGVQNMGLTVDQQNAYNNGQGDVAKLNGDLQEFHNQLNQLEIVVGEKVIPVFTKLLTAVNGWFDTASNKNNPNAGRKVIGHKRTVSELTGAVIDEPIYGPEPTKDDQKKAQQQQNEAAQAQDKAAQKNVDAQNQQAYLIQMFAGAVQTFSQAVNIQQAWAAWAGEIGRAGNILGASTNAAKLTGGGSGDWRGSQYAKQISAASRATGMDPQLIFATMMTESSGRNGQYSGTGPAGLMQVNRANWKRLGNGRDVMDPAANIMVGAQILAENLKSSGGNVDAALRAYNGNSDPNYVSKVGRYYAGSGIGQSKASAFQESGARNAIAQYLSVSPAQLESGNVSRGDVSFAVDNLEGGYLNQINKLKNDLNNPMLPASSRAQINREIFTQTNGLNWMLQNAPSLVGKSREGGQEITRDRLPSNLPAITNNWTINAAGMDAHKLASEIDKRLLKHFNDVTNHLSTSEKG